jgi:hypothetical protein
MDVKPEGKSAAATSIPVAYEPPPPSPGAIAEKPAADSKDGAYLWLGTFMGLFMSFFSFCSLCCFPYLDTNRRARRNFTVGCAVGTLFGTALTAVSYWLTYRGLVQNRADSARIYALRG